MLKKLKEEVLNANLRLKEKNLVIYTWGNVSGIERENDLVVIKPSGVAYNKLTPEQMVVVNLEGEVVEGELAPSSDTETHLELYRNFPEIGGVVHTHSTWATVWAQAGKSIPCLGTTHADHFYGEVPCTRPLTKKEIEEEYVLNTGKVIVEKFSRLDYEYTPGVLVAGHGPFTWGTDPRSAVKNSVVLEEVAHMAHRTVQLEDKKTKEMGISRSLRDKHFYRKHGADAYYGQK
ncbi:MAG: L-ribulose-5-phosphate 4-epimerase [Bacillota bacterium]